MLQNLCDQFKIIVWPLAYPYINYKFKNNQQHFSQNANFRLNTLLHGTLHMCLNLDIVHRWSHNITKMYIQSRCIIGFITYLYKEHIRKNLTFWVVSKKSNFELILSKNGTIQYEWYANINKMCIKRDLLIYDYSEYILKNNPFTVPSIFPFSSRSATGRSAARRKRWRPAWPSVARQRKAWS